MICSALWTEGKRLSKDDIPDIICSEEQMKKMKKISELQQKDERYKEKVDMCSKDKTARPHWQETKSP